MPNRKAYGTLKPTAAQEKRRQIPLSLPIEIARLAKEQAERSELTLQDWLRMLVEQALDAEAPLDDRAAGLLREVRAWLRPPKDATPQAKAGLRATRLVIEGRIRAFRGCLPALEWTRLATMAEQARKQALEGIVTPAEPPSSDSSGASHQQMVQAVLEGKEVSGSGAWEAMVVAKEHRFQPVVNAGGASRPYPTEPDEGEVVESASAGLEDDSMIAPESPDSDRDSPDAAIMPAISEPILSTEERTALEARLAEVEAILDRLGPHVEAPRSILLDTLNLSGQQLEHARQAFYEGPVYQTWLREREEREALSDEAGKIRRRLNRPSV